MCSYLASFNFQVRIVVFRIYFDEHLSEFHKRNVGKIIVFFKFVFCVTFRMFVPSKPMHTFPIFVTLLIPFALSLTKVQNPFLQPRMGARRHAMARLRAAGVAPVRARRRARWAAESGGGGRRRDPGRPRGEGAAALELGLARGDRGPR